MEPCLQRGFLTNSSPTPGPDPSANPELYSSEIECKLINGISGNSATSPYPGPDFSDTEYKLIDTISDIRALAFVESSNRDTSRSLEILAKALSIATVDDHNIDARVPLRSPFVKKVPGKCPEKLEKIQRVNEGMSVAKLEFVQHIREKGQTLTPDEMRELVWFVQVLCWLMNRVVFIKHEGIAP